MRPYPRVTAWAARMLFAAIVIFGAGPALAENISSTTILTVQDTDITSISPNFDIDKASGLSGIRTEISTYNSAYEDVNLSDSRVQYSTIDGLTYDPETRAVAFEKNGARTVCGYFTDDRGASRKGVKELVKNSDGTIRKPVGSDYVEYVDGSRKGEKIFFEKSPFDRKFFVPTGNCAFSIKDENKIVRNSFKSNNVAYKSVVLNVYPAGRK